MPHPDWPSMDVQDQLCQELCALLRAQLQPYTHLPLEEHRGLLLNLSAGTCARLVVEALQTVPRADQLYETSVFVTRLSAAIHVDLLAQGLREAGQLPEEETL